MKTVPELLESAGHIYTQRNTVYGNGYKDIGEKLEPFLCDINPETISDYNRMSIVMTILGKLARYCDNFHEGGHADSLDDIAVYSMMLRELDILGTDSD